MAKQKTNTVELSPLELAQGKAELMLSLNGKKEFIEKEIDDIKAELIEYVKQSGNKNLGAYQVTESEAKPKLNFGDMTDNAKKRVLEQLSQELPEYLKTKTELDLERLYYAMPSTPAVVNALKVRGLNFDLVTSLTFRKVK